EPNRPVRLDRNAPDPVQLALEDPRGVGEALVGEHGLHRLDETRCRGGSDLPSLARREVREAHPVFAAISSNVLPLSTDSGWLLTGRRRASASESRRLMRSHCGLAPALVRVRA